MKAYKEKVPDSLPWKEENGPSSVRPLELVFKDDSGEASERRWSAYVYIPC